MSEEDTMIFNQMTGAQFKGWLREHDLTIASFAVATGKGLRTVKRNIADDDVLVPEDMALTCTLIDQLAIRKKQAVIRWMKKVADQTQGTRR